MNTIGQRIKELRRTLGLNQTDFGKPIGAAQATIGGYERGNVPDMGVKSICNCYNVREEWLLSGDGEIFQPPKPAGEDALLGGLREKYRLGAAAVDILRGYLAMEEADRNALAVLIHRLASEVAAQPSPAPQKNPSEMVPEPENLRKIG